MEEPARVTRQLLAVVYAFERFENGERRLVSEAALPASAVGFLQPQLRAVPQRTQVDRGPGLLVYDNYQDARYAATTIATVATRVALQEVAVAPAGAGGGQAGWVGTGGVRYEAVPGGLSEIVKE